MTMSFRESCWSIAHSLGHCEGFRVSDESGPIGYVEAVRTTTAGEPRSIVVRVGSAFSVPVTYPIEAVENVDPASERVFVRTAVPTTERDERQLKLPTFA